MRSRNRRFDSTATSWKDSTRSQWRWSAAYRSTNFGSPTVSMTECYMARGGRWFSSPGTQPSSALEHERNCGCIVHNVNGECHVSYQVVGLPFDRHAVVDRCRLGTCRLFRSAQLGGS